jgi:hypothetical protein
MIHFFTAFGLLGHVLFWGAGAARLLMPRPWRRFWPVLVVPAGLALQSAVVWFGALAGLRGTDAYAGWSELLPAALLLAALRVGGGRSAGIDLSRFGLVAAAMGGCLLLLVLPLAVASPVLTTISLGSCDAADYAAGARVLQEFARGDRTGFLGLAEVVRVHSVDNFFEYWRQLNHFTPSALIALNGSVLGRAPHELTTLLTAVLLAGLLPLVFWVARAVFGYSGGVSLLVAGLAGVSPVLWYAVAHVAPGQLLAAHAVALLTWAGVALWRGRLTWTRGRQWIGLLVMAYWILLGSYNFFLLLCLVPAVAYAGGLALWRRTWGRLAGWGALMLGPLAACALAFPGRVAGLAERFSLLQAYEFGWPIPALTAEGWLGMVRGPDLAPWDFYGVRWLLSAAGVGLLVWACIRAAQQRSRSLWVVLAMLLPVLGGYWLLQVRGARLGSNASYDAYKLFAVFYPVLLPGFCWWVTLRRSRRLHEWLFVVGVAGVVGAFNLAACGMFLWHMSRPPLRVDPDLVALRRIEAMPDVRAVNLLIPDMWSRLWANAFLLRKGQYFETHTYEARRDTPLRGDWDLAGGIVAVRLPGPARRPVAGRFALVDTREPGHLRVATAEGWYGIEPGAGAAVRWEWIGREAVLHFDNPHARPMTVRVELDARAFGARELRLRPAADEAGGAPVRLGAERTKVSFGPIELPAGRSRWVLQSTEPAVRAGPGDPRLIAVCVYGVTVEAAATHPAP